MEAVHLQILDKMIELMIHALYVKSDMFVGFDHKDIEKIYYERAKKDLGVK